MKFCNEIGRKNIQTHLKRQISNFLLNLSPCCILADIFLKNVLFIEQLIILKLTIN